MTQSNIQARTSCAPKSTTSTLNVHRSSNVSVSCSPFSKYSSLAFNSPYKPSESLCDLSSRVTSASISQAPDFEYPHSSSLSLKRNSLPLQPINASVSINIMNNQSNSSINLVNQTNNITKHVNVCIGAVNSIHVENHISSQPVDCFAARFTNSDMKSNDEKMDSEDELDQVETDIVRPSKKQKSSTTQKKSKSGIYSK